MEEYSFEPFEKEEEDVSDFRKEEAYLRAKKKVESLVGFYWHLASYIVVNAFLIILIGINTSFTSFGPYATAVFWGIGLLFHFIGVFGQDRSEGGRGGEEWCGSCWCLWSGGVDK